MRLSTVPALFTLVLHARLAMGASFSFPIDLRGLEDINIDSFDVDDGLEPWDWDEAAPPGVKIPGNNPLYLCGADDSADTLKIKNVDFSPVEPVRGTELVVSSKGVVSAPIQKGTTVRVQIRLNKSKVFDKKYDLCKGIEHFGQACPFAPGAVEINKGVMVSKKIPHGHYSARIKVDTPDKKQVTCLTASLKL